MPTLDDLTPDAFARLSALEQSQELLRRAQFLDASSRARHTAALDRHQAMIDAHEAAHVDHAFRMAHLENMLLRQQQLQTQLTALQERMDARVDDHAQRMAQLQLILEAILAMLRNRNGH